MIDCPFWFLNDSDRDFWLGVDASILIFVNLGGSWIFINWSKSNYILGDVCHSRTPIVSSFPPYFNDYSYPKLSNYSKTVELELSGRLSETLDDLLIWNCLPTWVDYRPLFINNWSARSTYTSASTPAALIRLRNNAKMRSKIGQLKNSNVVPTHFRTQVNIRNRRL